MKLVRSYLIGLSLPGLDSAAANIWVDWLDEHCFRFKHVCVGSETIVVVIALKIFICATTRQVENILTVVVGCDIPLRIP